MRLFLLLFVLMGIKKKYRLKSRKRIGELFSSGEKIFHYPLQCLFLPTEEKHYRIAFVVGKKKIRKAHERNTVKRRMREQVRLHLNTFYAEKTYDILFVYQASNVLESTVIKKGVENIFSSLK